MMPKATPMLYTECYIIVEPERRSDGIVNGVKPVKLSRRAPQKGYSIKVRLSVPQSVFQPFEAEVEVPESAVDCKVIPIAKEQTE
jgi:hypothetical protein